MAPAAKKMKVIGPDSPSCVGCQVLEQKDETNEQNVNLHRMEMADRWRLQEEDNKTLRAGISNLGTVMTGHMEKLNARFNEHLDMIHKLEKSIIYAAVAVGISAIGTIGAAILSLVSK